MLVVAAGLFVAGGALLLTMGRYPGEERLKEALAWM